MPDYRNWVSIERVPLSDRPIPAIWDFFSCHAGSLEGVSEFFDYYINIDENLHL